MADNRSLREYYKCCVFVFIYGFGGSVWGGMTYFLGIPVAYLNFLKASPTQIGAVTAIFWAVNIGIILPMIFLPIIVGKLMGLNMIGFNGAFGISVVLMVAAILYIIVVVDNPKAFVEMKTAVQ